ncbi:MAG: hypothetical protein EOO13_04755 [Chitinophagaceae bacterium]|nr:MAG: hypothetical protein EOO13_04755 [Chitinophagaceae bacterium]
MRPFFLALLLLASLEGSSQELYVYTEPASNMAARSVGFRLNNNLMRIAGTNHYNYMASPEIMLGVSRHIMLHAEAFLSNRNDGFKLDGGMLYAKYRFYSEDEVHSHFRMAAYVRGSANNTHIHQPAIDLQGMNSGVETGLVATKLQDKVALSASVAHLYAMDNADGNKFYYPDGQRQALNYSLSAGRLMLPKEYTSYKQTNVNLMTELLGQTNLATGKTFLDIAPSVQFIFHSRMRVDLGYRFGLVKQLQRTSSDGALLRLEYNIFNAF